MAEKNNASIGFEEKIWAAADELRGNLDASEYKHVVLGLIFLKYISDKFETRYDELLKEGEDMQDDKDEYTRKGVFFVPKVARWNHIAESALTPSIGIVIDEAMVAIEKENTELESILPKNFARPELDKRRLGNIVNLFTNIKMQEHDGEKDILGRVYEYCLSRFASQEGKNAGEFYTPSCIVKTLVDIIKPFRGRVYDPACGSGGMFVQSAKFIKEHSGEINDISVYGQESNPTTWKMCKMNLAIRGIESDLGKSYDDTFFNDLHKHTKFDYILANPPFNLSNWGGDKLKEDQRWKFGTPPEGNANFAWMQHMIWHMNPAGSKIGMVLSNGSLSSGTSGEGDIRANIIKADLIEGIVAMPPQLFYSTAIPVCLWILNNKKKQKGKTLFVDARNLGTMKTRKLRELTEEDIAKIAGEFEQFEEGTQQNQTGFSYAADIEEIKQNDYILTPGRFVGIEAAEKDAEPYDEKIDRLKQELDKLFEKSNNLQKEIAEQLGKI